MYFLNIIEIVMYIGNIFYKEWLWKFALDVISVHTALYTVIMTNYIYNTVR